MMCKKTLNIHNQHKVLEKEKIYYTCIKHDRIYTCTTAGLKFLQGVFEFLSCSIMQ